MLAYQLVNRKVMFQWKGKEKVAKCFIEKYEVKDDKAKFTFTTITGRTFEAVDGEFNIQLNETEIESITRRKQYSLRMYGGLDEETRAKVNEALGEDVIEMAKDAFEKEKAKLTTLRIEKSKLHRQYYHEGKLHIFYDIKHGNNVDRFLTMEELQKTKDNFAKADFHNNYKPKELDNLQAFDENYNLVIDEWDI
jgi:bisphosphoglycerate-dependent phosphoglycerate mutase